MNTGDWLQLLIMVLVFILILLFIYSLFAFPIWLVACEVIAIIFILFFLNRRIKL